MTKQSEENDITVAFGCVCVCVSFLCLVKNGSNLPFENCHEVCVPVCEYLNMHRKLSEFPVATRGITIATS